MLLGCSPPVSLCKLSIAHLAFPMNVGQAPLRLNLEELNVLTQLLLLSQLRTPVICLCWMLGWLVGWLHHLSPALLPHVRALSHLALLGDKVANCPSQLVHRCCHRRNRCLLGLDRLHDAHALRLRTAATSPDALSLYHCCYDPLALLPPSFQSAVTSAATFAIPASRHLF